MSVVGKDGSRGLKASTVGTGGPKDAEGQYNVALDFKNARQAIPNPDMRGDGQINFSGSLGEKELLGQGATEADEGQTDDEYPSLPNVTLPGELAPSGNATPIDFQSVAPYEYPEYPKDGYKAGGGAGPIPLT